MLTNSNPSLVPAVREGYDPKNPAPRHRRADQIRIISMTLQPGEDLIVGKRLRDILNVRRKGIRLSVAFITSGAGMTVLSSTRRWSRLTIR